MRRITLPFLALALLGLMPQRSQAEPVLQLYIEGSTYNSATESWEVDAGNTTFRLWAIGNTGKQLPIEDVRLSAAYDAAATDVTIELTPSTVDPSGPYGTFDDPSTPSAPSFTGLSDGSGSDDDNPERPILGVSSSFIGDPGIGMLPNHGEFGPGIVWQEFALGDFTLTDSHLGDFITSFPTSLKPNEAQINVYEVKVNSATSGLTVHFDLYNHVEADNNRFKVFFAPFSHDASTGGNGGDDITAVPEPASLALCGFGSVLLGLGWRRRRRNAAKNA